jgi:hypothetical protein
LVLLELVDTRGYPERLRHAAGSQDIGQKSKHPVAFDIIM